MFVTDCHVFHSILMCGSEDWTPLNQPRTKLNPLNEKSFERYLDLPIHKECGDSDTTMGYAMYMDIPPSTYIQKMRLKWDGDIIRMEDYHILQKILGGKRPVDRPRSRWEDNVQRVGVSLLHT